MQTNGDTTRLLLEGRAGDRAALDALFSHVYEEMKSIARYRLRRDRGSDTINTTVLVHETYVKLVDGKRTNWQDRAHFFALASRAMRFILVDHARARLALKRGGEREVVTLDELQVAGPSATSVDLIHLNDALERLMTHSERLGRVVECRFFGGMTLEDIAAVTGHSVPTVKRDWARARTWLYQFMGGE